MNKFWKILGSVGPVVVGIAGLIVDLAASKVHERTCIFSHCGLAKW